MFASNTSQVSNGAVYVEDVFQTWLSTGNGTSRTVTGPDMTLGGLSITKSRSAATGWRWVDTARGAGLSLESNSTAAQATESTGVTAFTTTGTSIGSDADYNTNGATYVDYLLKKQPKFFDVVTYTGNGANRTIAHSLGSVPGCIIVKRTDTTADWQVYHRSLANTEYMVLNTTAAKATGTTRWNSTTPTDTVFSLGTDTTVNANGGTYVAYLFAHNAGGFGTSNTDNVISCGSFTTDASGNATVNLGYEPQWIIVKASSTTSNWFMRDNMRGWVTETATGTSSALNANLTNAEALAGGIGLSSTGFVTGLLAASSTYIYIAIRRGPMKTPTSGTSVFGLNARTGTGANATVTGSAGVSDAVLIKNRGSAVGDLFASRLTGTGYLETSSTAAEVAAGTTILQANPWDVMDGVKVGTTSTITNASSNTYINYLFDRAPGFFDVVCYAGNDVAGRTINHNLTVTPELIICKARTTGGSSDSWNVQIPGTGTYNTWAQLNTNATPGTVGASFLFSTSNSTTLTVSSTVGYVNSVGVNYVVYLFATCAGVSKVGSYTGNGTNQTINCGFTGGARFLMIKRTDSTGDWYVWDTARGIVTGNDPWLLLNSTAAEVTTDDTIDPANSGFIVNQLAATNVNVNAATYIYLAIA